ncbi:MAG: nucleoside kinase, partial [Oscillospiraceae bacterium]
INHLEQINDAAIATPQEMIEEVETSYHDHLEDIARNIVTRHGGAKICMLSGPSSSGKTTTAHLLQAFLREFGRSTYIVSLDNFYLPMALTPTLADGRHDFETIHALDIVKIRDCLENIITDGTIEIPNFDFSIGEAVGAPTIIDIKDGDLVIMEGIHGLNPIFTKSIPPEKLIRLYVSVKQQIKDANGEVLNPGDLRLVRRIVRD